MRVRAETGLIRDLIKDEIVLAELSWQLSGNNLWNGDLPSFSLPWGWGSWAQSVSPSCAGEHVYWTLWHLWTCSSLNLGSNLDPRAAGGHCKKTQPNPVSKKFVWGSVRAHPKSPWALSRFSAMQKGEGNMESIWEGSLWQGDTCVCTYRLSLASSKPWAQGIVSFCDPFYAQKKQKSFYNEKRHFLLLCCRKSPSPLNPRNLHSVVNNNEV